jgi:hypothetical protein
MPGFPVGRPRPVPLVPLLELSPAIMYDAFVKVIMQVVHQMRWHLMIMIACNVDEHV